MTRVIEADRAVLPHPEHLDATWVGPARVTVEGPRITAVERDPPSPAPEGAERIRAPHVLVPAFVDGHTHLALHGLRGAASLNPRVGNLVEDVFFAVEEHLTAEDVRALSRVGALEALLSGTAVVHDHYYFGRAVAQALVDTGLAGLVAPALQDLAGPGSTWWDEGLDATVALDEDPALAARGIGAMVGPHATDTVSDSLWHRLAELADARNLPIHVHIAQSIREVRRAVEHADTTPLGRVDRLGVLQAGAGWLLVHGLFLHRTDRPRIDPAHHTMVACPRSWARFAFPAATRAWFDDMWPVAAGSDASASNDATCVQAELAALDLLTTASTPSLARLRREDATLWTPLEDARHLVSAYHTHKEIGAPSVDTLFRAATDVPGAIHPRFRAGVIAPGAMAHLSVYDAHHPTMWPGDALVSTLVYGRPQAALQRMMVAGRWLTDPNPGGFAAALMARPEVRDWLDEATARRRELLARAGVT